MSLNPCLPILQILMLSGVGPKSELQKHGIDQVVDLPVGRNLQDHCMVLGAQLTVGKPDGQMTTDALELLNPMTLVEYYSKGTGPLSNNGMNMIGVMHTKQQPKGKDKRPGDDLHISLNTSTWHPRGCGSVVERSSAMRQVASSIPAQVCRLLFKGQLKIHCKCCYFVGSRLVGSQPTVSLAGSRK